MIHKQHPFTIHTPNYTKLQTLRSSAIILPEDPLPPHFLDVRHLGSKGNAVALIYVETFWAVLGV